MIAKADDIATLRKRLLAVRAMAVVPERDIQLYYFDRLGIDIPPSFGEVSEGERGHARETVGAVLRKVRLNGNGRTDPGREP